MSKTLIDLKTEYRIEAEKEHHLLEEFRKIEAKQDKAINEHLRLYVERFGDLRARDRSNKKIFNKNKPVYLETSNTAERNRATKLYIQVVGHIQEVRKDNYENIGGSFGKNKSVLDLELVVDGTTLLQALDNKIESYSQTNLILETKLKAVKNYMRRFNKNFFKLEENSDGKYVMLGDDYKIATDKWGNIEKGVIEPLRFESLTESKLNIEIINRFICTLQQDDFQDKNKTETSNLITDVLEMNDRN